MAPAISACFGAIIFLLIKFVVHIRKNPVPWAVWTAPFFFLIAATICTLSVVYKGSPRLGLNKKPGWYIAAVTLGTGVGVSVLSAIFFVPFLHARVIKKDYSVKWYMFVLGPLLFSRPPPPDADQVVANVPNYAVIQEDDVPEVDSSKSDNEGDSNGVHQTLSPEEKERRLTAVEAKQLDYK